MPQNRPKIKLALKYCGSCNPHFDLLRTGRYLTEMVGEASDFELAPLSANDTDVVVILCGCPRACANKEEVRARARHYLVINEESQGDPAYLANSLRSATNL